MIVAIPSKNRVDGMTALRFFSNPVIFVEPQDYDIYKKKHPDKKIINIGANDKGFGYVLNKIVDYTLDQGEKYYLFVDDDIFGMKNRDKEFEESEFLENGEEIISRIGLAQLGVSFSGHNWYYKKSLKFDTAIWGMGFMDAEKIKKLGGYDENLMLFNDYEITARLMIKKERVANWYNYMFVHKMRSAEGGANTFYKKKDFTKHQIIYLYRRYKKYMKIFYHKKHDIWEFRFNWNKLKSANVG